LTVQLFESSDEFFGRRPPVKAAVFHVTRVPIVLHPVSAFKPVRFEVVDCFVGRGY